MRKRLLVYYLANEGIASEKAVHYSISSPLISHQSLFNFVHQSVRALGTSDPSAKNRNP